VVGARDPEFIVFVADQAVREDEGAFVRTHLLGGEVFAFDSEDGQLSVTSLDGSGNAIGGEISAFEVRRLDDRLPAQTGPFCILEILRHALLCPEHRSFLAT